MSAKEDEGAADGKELAAIIRRVTEEYGPIAGQDDCSSGLDQVCWVYQLWGAASMEPCV